MSNVKTYSNSRSNLLFPTYLCDYMHECAKNGDSPNDVLLGIIRISYDLKEEFGTRIRNHINESNISLYMKQSLKHEKLGTLLEWRNGVNRNFK
jgi:hypothetical protein